jgi:hypothetical protein
MRRIGEKVGTMIRERTATLFGEPWRAVRSGQWRRFWFGVASPLLVIVLYVAARNPTGHAWIHAAGVIHADDSFGVTLARLPLSLFAPAHMLPVWAAVLQTAVVFGCGQVLLGSRRTFVVGFAGHALATLSARLWVSIDPPFGVADRAHWVHFADAGPSVAVIAVAAFIMVRYRVAWIAFVLFAFDLSELVTLNGLTQREHIVGLTVGALFALAAPVTGWVLARLGDLGSVAVVPASTPAAKEPASP